MNRDLNVISNYIHVMENFQYSINIGYDLFSDEKIENYIPTTSAIDIIEDIVLSTSPTSTDRARIFTGPYGKGKSHLALVLLSILCRNDESLYTNLLTTICQTKPELCTYITNYHNNNKKMLPVVIQGTGMGIKQSLLLGLKKALENVDLGTFMPETYFKAAISVVKKWKKEFPETYKQFEAAIDSTVTDFIDELSMFNYAYYEKFIKIYPTLTSGSEFNPVNGVDVVALYSEVCKKIKDCGFSGIFIVYDEFSKYLEGNIKKIPGDEIKALQDFAECCNRSKENQLHLLLISHKSILNYMDNLSKTKVDAWKAVSNRFKSIELNTSAAQTYDLISKVVTHDEPWYLDYKEQHSSSFRKVLNNWKEHKCFSDVTPEIFEDILFKCYPLSPATLYILPKISEAIAQNERTLFTFLSAKSQKNTLPKYLDTMSKDTFDMVFPDIIFDYFEPLFKSEAYDKPIHKFWKSAVVACGKLSDNQKLEKKLLKTIALIYIVNRFDVLPPSMSVLTTVYDCGSVTSQDVISALMNLKESGIVRVLDGKNYLRIAEHTDVDINQLIANETEKAKIITSAKSILNDFIGEKVLYPNAYNDDKSVTRFFDLTFVTASELLGDFNSSHYIANACGDGVVFAVVPDIEQSVEKIISKEKHNRILFIVPKQAELIVEQLYTYWAIKNYISISEDVVVTEELSYSLVDLEETISEYIDNYLKPENNAANYYYQGKKKTIKRRSALSALLTSICNDVYKNFPIINNEMINKNKISSQAANSRNKVVAALLETQIKPNLGLNGSSQEMSFMRSTLRMPGILITNGDEDILTITKINDKKLQNVLNTIRDFIISTSSEGKKSFAELYDILTSPENSIGLKKGIIPIYVAAVLHFHKKHVVITKGNKEIELSSRLLEAINEKPDEYFIYLEEWDAQKEAYVSGLVEIFKKYASSNEIEYNNFEYVVKAIQRWYLQLPKYAKETKMLYTLENEKAPVSKETLKFINIIKAPEINAREFLFEKIVETYNCNAITIDICNKILATKTLLDNAKSGLISYIRSELRKIFGGSSADNESFTSVMLNWYDSLHENVKNHMFNGVENSLLNAISEITPNDVDFIEKFAKLATGLRIDDWADITVEGFFVSVNSFVDTINSYAAKLSEEATESSSGTYKITFTDETGTEVTKTFDKTSYSRFANLMYNDVESMIDEYGDALSKNEKRQVLIDIINKVLG